MPCMSANAKILFSNKNFGDLKPVFLKHLLAVLFIQRIHQFNFVAIVDLFENFITQVLVFRQKMHVKGL